MEDGSSPGASDMTKTIVREEVPDSFEELSEYLEVLSNSQRLRILKMLEKKPRDVRTIASEIQTSYENTKKHLDRLMAMGLIRKEVGLGQETSKGVHPVWKYSLVPGAMEAVIRNLGFFSNMRIQLADQDLKRRLGEVRSAIEGEITGNRPVLIVLGGPQDGKFFFIGEGGARIGRIDQTVTADESRDVVLANDYSSVSRISRPHAVLRKEGKKWFIEDRGSTGGTFLNGNPLRKGVAAEVADGDLIELAKGPAGAKLLVILPGGGS
ncbi:MAG: FHA domain-containing protein [Methanolinea sp.]|nr:FHA domain-containing protein [Methanolinea sp.]